MDNGVLLFTYIDSSRFGIKKQCINFSNDFHISYSKGKLTIKKEEKERFYGDSISNITLIIGKNGAGKSSILQLISLDKKSRKKYLPNTVYFSIYHVQDDQYYFEGSPSLARKLLNDPDFSKEEFSFKIKHNQIVSLPKENNQETFLTTVYQTLSPNVDWSEKKKLSSSNGGCISKKFTSTVGIDKVINFITKYLSHDEEFKNAKFIFRQRQKYNSKPGELLFLYEATVNNQNLTYIRDLELGYQQFLSDFNTDGNYKEDHYTREKQDEIFGEDVRGYFILRMLEKIYLSKLNELAWTTSNKKNTSKRDALIKVQENKVDFIRRVGKVDIDNLGQRIEFLLFIIEHSFDFVKKESISGLSKLINFFNRIPIDRFENSNQFILEIDMFSDYEYELVSIIEKNFSNIIDVKARHLSDGQYVYCSTFTQIFETVQEDLDHNLLLVLDEPDINMHPEWSRCFINNVLELIPSVTNKKVQLLISTHSPFLVSDIPNKNVYHIQNEGKNKKISTVKKSFAANIYDIISEGFYLEYPIGEFARKKIESIKSKDSNIIDIIDDPFLSYVLTRGEE